MNAAAVRALAQAAGLSLAPGRCEAAAELLAVWLPAANELSRKMSAAEHQRLLPATVFVHAAVDDEG